ncbi:MAG TPA: DUF6502 family protein [Gammaproteobacteria bacterium]|jgi:hypothetical protein|nr:DUF6502 family protein [Gammaproteobacteria bacterium]
MATRQPVLQKTLVSLMVRTLRPIARIALRHCMSCLEFEDIARWVFVDVALNDPLLSLGARGKQFKSRAAILTGLSRKEVMRLSRRAAPGEDGALASRNRAARVVAGWMQPPYVDGRGAPKVLVIKGSGDSFLQLVRSCGGDVPYRAILDELLDCGVAERVEGKGVRLKSKGRLYPRGSHEALQKAGDGLDGMLAQIERHLHADTRR